MLRDGASAVRRDHEATRSGAIRRPAHRTTCATSRTIRVSFPVPVRRGAGVPRRSGRSRSTAHRSGESRTHATRTDGASRIAGWPMVAFVADAQLRPDSVVQVERDSLAQSAIRQKARRRRPQRCRHLRRADRRRNAAARSPHGWARKRSRLVAGQQAHRVHWAPGRMKSARVYVVLRVAGRPRTFSATSAYEPESIEWLRDGSIAMTTSVGGSSAVFRIDPATKKMTQVLGGRRRINGASFDATAKKVAFVAHRPHASDGAVRRERRRQQREEAHELQRQDQRGSRVVRRRALHLSSRSAVSRSKAG